MWYKTVNFGAEPGEESAETDEVRDVQDRELVEAAEQRTPLSARAHCGESLVFRVQNLWFGVQGSEGLVLRVQWRFGVQRSEFVCLRV